ncbi:hypothetical protein FNL53_07060 [Tardiphaga sp. vice278]|nr:hypothetical protein FNL53_07060 [Tardiphaga sp. vice278]
MNYKEVVVVLADFENGEPRLSLARRPSYEGIPRIRLNATNESKSPGAGELFRQIASLGLAPELLARYRVDTGCNDRTTCAAKAELVNLKLAHELRRTAVRHFFKSR